ncbi:hypothetical protein [Clavibacter sp. Sh2088]|uniref:hypothetical protein n=1 Tax=Clavibacter sp. Sh2088 TaxID=3397676 RepID=UPI0039DF9ACD
MAAASSGDATTPADGSDGPLAPVVLRGRLLRPVARIRTAEGWEVASLLVGGCDADGSRDRAGVPGVPGVLATCTGTAASTDLAGLAVGEEVVVTGVLRARRAGRPEDDVVELEADAVLARRRPGAAGPATATPRIAP